METVGRSGDATAVEDGTADIGDRGLALERVAFEANDEICVIDHERWWFGQVWALGWRERNDGQRFDDDEPFRVSGEGEWRQGGPFVLEDQVETGWCFRRGSGESCGEFERLALANDRELELRCGSECTHHGKQLVGMEERPVINAHNDNMGLEGGGNGRASGGNGEDDSAAGEFWGEMSPQCRGHHAFQLFRDKQQLAIELKQDVMRANCGPGGRAAGGDPFDQQTEGGRQIKLSFQGGTGGLDGDTKVSVVGWRRYRKGSEHGQPGEPEGMREQVHTLPNV